MDSLIKLKDLKMKKILMSAITMGALSISANAACVGNNCSNVDVEKIVVTQATMYIATSGTETGLTNCTPVSGIFITLSSVDAASKAIYSALLTAQTTHKKVKIRTKDTPGARCQIDYIEL